jgi:hypothetical protein
MIDAITYELVRFALYAAAIACVVVFGPRGLCIAVEAAFRIVAHLRGEWAARRRPGRV